MREIKEVLRLRFELGLGQRAIARACSISQSTVHEYLNRAASAGVGWERHRPGDCGPQRPPRSLGPARHARKNQACGW
jgi:hypothetical protein